MEAMREDNGPLRSEGSSGGAMRVLIRADASSVIGSGHVMRCMTLARALRRQGATVGFVSREGDGDLHGWIAAQGFGVHALADTLDEAEDAACSMAILADNGPVAWMVLDHYGLGVHWESRVGPRAGRLLVIDDSPRRPHVCDVLLDPNWSEGGEVRWQGLVPADCRALCGPRFALLREEFFTARDSLRVRDGRVRRILVSFGGADREGAARLAVDALVSLTEAGRLDGVTVDVVAGAANPHREALREAVARLPDGAFAVSADNMAERMAMADLALGAGGGTIWERCYLGLPALVVTIADNQREATEAVARFGAHRDLGPLAAVTVDRMVRAVEDCLHDPEGLRRAGARGMMLMDEPEFIRHPLDWLI